ncbi:DUF4350 domain-containing protein [Arthrobacter roseus]|uniref:DUF4350 domain-containing protein n=1 Tax=Arthrobacter roseus TaxID=136274 RepID=UPI0019659063|nr:DUF4350 domain-containing protein [Arthrobacter roseus]MBM7849117.1 hypothetical protein [Arthrobacter roseus]
MTAAGLGGAPTAEETDTTGSSGSSRWRSIRFWGILAVLVVAVTVVAILTRTSEDRTALSPHNPAPNGAQAVAQVLTQRGITIKYATTLEEALEHLEEAGEPSTLFLSDPSMWLDPDQLQRLASGGAGKTVLAAPAFDQLESLAPTVRQAGQMSVDEGQTVEARCSLPAATAASTITAGGQAYRGGTVCFLPAEGERGAGSLVVTDSGTTTVLGNPSLMNNATITDQGNAALALHVLGSEPVLVWYQPTINDLQATAQPQNPTELLPPWVGLLAVWLLIVAAFAAFWRGRRMGPLVAERLPVVVRSSETADGRARLYQDSKAVVRAAENLRSASLLRITRHLGLGRTPEIAAIVAATARALSRDPHIIAVILDRPAPISETDLVRWAQELTALEKEVATA